tara:strand:- start:1090 stop:1635 length:546 start_codon:yes stop_codon:yes gene_type:complete
MPKVPPPNLSENKKLLEDFDIKKITDYRCTLCVNAKAADSVQLALLSGSDIKECLNYIYASYGIKMHERELRNHKRNHLQLRPKDYNITTMMEAAKKKLGFEASVKLEDVEIITAMVNRLTADLDNLTDQGQTRTKEFMDLSSELRKWMEMRVKKPAIQLELTPTDLLKQMVLGKVEDNDG